MARLDKIRAGVTCKKSHQRSLHASAEVPKVAARPAFKAPERACLLLDRKSYKIGIERVFRRDINLN
eukprot:s1242_g2.t1